MSIYDAIRRANSLLPGEPLADDDPDPRWQAIIAIGEFVHTEPQSVWEFTQVWGCHAQEDLRTAIATCLLEHLLEYHFAAYFPRVERLSTAEPLFGDTFLRCSKFGQSREPGNAAWFDGLTKLLREKRHSL